MGALKYHLLYTFLKVLVQFKKIIKSGEEKKKQIPQALPVIGVFQVFPPPAEPILLLWFLYIPHVLLMCNAEPGKMA